ncbi:hypothetical protein [Rhodohalobacter halophilus]|uniref:hypothetical protein n=1 Tax=Rhodohalobacter halophilus TaxID=1812810 RepID=UPI00083FA8DE|nr:hypothetical protein [Rhodohalobacter halophilus]
MIDNSNKSKDVEGSQLISGASNRVKTNPVQFIFSNTEAIIPNVAAMLQIFTGIALISLSVLGQITPYWFSAIISIIGSVSCMMGVLLVYHTSAKKRLF